MLIVGDLGDIVEEESDVLEVSAHRQQGVVDGEVALLGGGAHPGVVVLGVDMHPFLFQTLVEGSDVISGDLCLEVVFYILVLIIVDHVLQNLDIFGLKGRVDSCDVAGLGVVGYVRVISHFEYYESLLHSQQFSEGNGVGEAVGRSRTFL